MSSKASTKERERCIAQIRAVTSCSTSEATRLAKKTGYSVERAIDAYFAEGGGSAMAGPSAAESKAIESRVGAIFDKFKDPDNPSMITIDGTMSLCESLGIDPASDPVLFCLAADLGSKTVGEWTKEPWIKGWKAYGNGIDSLAKIKAHLPTLRTALNTDPDYFKKVYLHVFELSKAAGARTLVLEQALSFWQVLIPPALAARPSALSHLITDASTGEQIPSPDGEPQFTTQELEYWLEFQKEKGKAVSRDTWSLFIEFVRVIDRDFKEHDEDGAWPSTIDDFVDYVRKKKQA